MPVWIVVKQEVVKAMLHYGTESVKVVPPERIHLYRLTCIACVYNIPAIRAHLHLSSSSFTPPVSVKRVPVFVKVPAQFINHVPHMLSRDRWIQELLSPSMDLCSF